MLVNGKPLIFYKNFSTGDCMDLYIENLKKTIILLCNEKNISINKLATLTGITQSTLAGIMNGESLNPKLATLIKLADFFEIPLDALVGRPISWPIEEAATLERPAI